MEVPLESRVNKVQKRMRDQDVDLVLLNPGPNMSYVTGFDAEILRSHVLLAIPREGHSRLFAPSIIESEIKEIGVETTFWNSESLEQDLVKFLEQYDPELVLLDDNMKEITSRDVRDILDSKLGLASEVMSYVRAVKSAEEIANIRKAVDMADRIFADIRDLDPVGMTENELSDFIENKIEEYGGEGPSFETIVASGSNSANPHHLCSDKTIEAGEPVVIDFGCWINGYPSDQTRTMVFGNVDPSSKFKEVFDLVREAQNIGVNTVEPGNTNLDVGKASRDFLRERGISDEFIMGRGHGIGLEIHEDPKIPSRDHEITMELEPGMVFTVEPGVYIKDEFGVRIEDVVLVTEDGFERLNSFSRGWR